jgi:glyoxylase-like metal-dependent hydrolase (beta-lactamase superfamily II)
LRLRAFTGGPFGQNGYLAVCEQSGAVVLIDPGAGASGMVRQLIASGTEPTAILLTHAHLDHIDGISMVRDAFPDVPIHLHPADRPLYDAAPLQAERFGLPPFDVPPPTHELAGGQRIEFGVSALEVRHAPGHSPGHVILWAEADGVAFVGDVIFAGSIGRTDLPGGDFRTLIESIRREVLTLPPATSLFSGHGPETTVEWEARHNPFLIPHYGGELA